jgi:polyphenol oxidase
MRAEVLRSSLLSGAGFAHGFATRRGGVSSIPFDSLNFRVAGSERPENVAENLRLLAGEVGFAPAELHLVDQVHGARVVVADGRGDARERDGTSAVPPRRGPHLGPERGRDSTPLRGLHLDEADAVVLAGRAAGGVRVADCVPVLVGDLFSGRAAVIHAGWRGIEAGIVGAALAALGDSRRARVAAVGPCIGPCCFEVGVDVAERIARAAGDRAVVVGTSGDKAHVDLRRAVRSQLRMHGMGASEVEDVEGCTMCDEQRFFSFRRDGDESGRHLAVIVAKAG